MQLNILRYDDKRKKTRCESGNSLKIDFPGRKNSKIKGYEIFKIHICLKFA